MKVYVISLGRKFLYFQWICPITGRRLTRSSKCKTRRDAERKASILENQLSSAEDGQGRCRWKTFRSLYENEHLAGLAANSEYKAIGILDSFERLAEPTQVHRITAGTLSAYVAKLRDAGRSEATIAGHLRQLKAGLRWAKDRGFLSAVPAMPRIHRQAGKRLAKGRPVTHAEFANMLRATKTICGKHWKSWTRILRGLWLSGLRLGEAVKLRWTPGNWPYIDGESLVIPAEFDKAHQDRRIPLPPDFAAWLQRTPIADRTGVVFQPLGELGKPVQFFRVSQRIAKIGEHAGIITDPATGRTATAHDLRRSFAQRWASRLTPVDLQRLMRHASIATTMGYYVDQDAEGLAKRMRMQG